MCFQNFDCPFRFYKFYEKCIIYYYFKVGKNFSENVGRHFLKGNVYESRVNFPVALPNLQANS